MFCKEADILSSAFEKGLAVDMQFLRKPLHAFVPITIVDIYPLNNFAMAAVVQIILVGKMAHNVTDRRTYPFACKRFVMIQICD